MHAVIHLSRDGCTGKSISLCKDVQYFKADKNPREYGEGDMQRKGKLGNE